MDRFTEQVVVKKNRMANEILYYLALAVMVVCGLYALFLLQYIFMDFSVPALIELVVSAGIAVVLFLFRDRLRAEYEYTFTNGDLDFAMVFNNQKRKNLGSLKVRNVEAFGKVNSETFKRYVSMPGIKTNNWFLNRGAELYYFYFQKESNKRLIIMEPNEEMVDFIKQYLPRGAFQDK